MMKWISASALLLASFIAMNVAAADELVLAENGKSAYTIVVADDASPSTKHGAEELQTFLKQITGAKLPIGSDRRPQAAAEIVLGNNARLRKLDVKIDFDSKRVHPSEYDPVIKDPTKYIKDKLKIEQAD